MPTYHPPVSGIVGNVIINSYDYPASYWDYKMQSTGLPLNSSSSIPWVDMLQGSKTCVVTAGGIVRSDFNPFGAVSPPNPAKLNTFANVKCETIKGTEYASCPIALITYWDYKDSADGMATWEMQAIGSFTFQDFSHTNA